MQYRLDKLHRPIKQLCDYCRNIYTDQRDHDEKFICDSCLKTRVKNVTSFKAAILVDNVTVSPGFNVETVPYRTMSRYDHDSMDISQCIDVLLDNIRSNIIGERIDTRSIDFMMYQINENFQLFIANKLCVGYAAVRHDETRSIEIRYTTRNPVTGEEIENRLDMNY